MNKFTGLLNRVGFWTRRKSPELLVAGAIVAAAGSIILAIRATPKAEVIVKKANEDISKIKSDMSDDNKLANGHYSLKAGKKDLTRVYFGTAYKLGKLYLPTVIGFGLTVTGILSSHKIMRGRNVALAAAYTTLENGYKSYRNRVAAKVGEKVENDIFRNIYESNKDIVIDKDGEEVVVNAPVKGPHVQVDSDFTVIFDNTSRDWYRDTHFNVETLRNKEKWLNRKLVHSGALFLHEVYEELGIDISSLGEQKIQASRILGWIYDTQDPTRDSYISIGLFDKMGNNTQYTMDAIRNNDQELFLEFNVDGDILTGSNGKRTFMKNRNVI